MQSLVKSCQILSINKRCLDGLIRRGVRVKPLVIDMAPNYYETIDIKLNKINYYENQNNLTNIGFTDKSEVKQKFYTIRESLNNDSAVKHIEDNDEEVEEIVNYSQIYKKWVLSEEGIKSTIDLANHYMIFTHLFPPLDSGMQKSKDDGLAPKPVYYFSPIVPIDVQFNVNQTNVGSNEVVDEDPPKTQSSDEIIVSRVFRGNLLYSQYCMNAPNVTIDCSAINGINNFGDQSEDENLGEEISGHIKLLNDNESYYTLALINLDSFFGNESNVCHWMITNIHNKDNVTKYENIIKYLPIYGVKGLGYHRFVFVLYQHKNPLTLEKINDFDLEKRKFDAFKFMSSHGLDNKLTPIGLSWFQSTWDDSSQKVFYDYLNMRSPTFEWVEPKTDVWPTQLQFPCRAPFNLYLDHFRDPKEMAKSVLLERLSSINPFKYENMFDVNPLPPHIHPIPKETPDWLKGDIKKRREKVGIFRGLRPHSAIIPLDNNADLDKPFSPRVGPKVHPLNLPIKYPDGKRRPTPLKDTLWVKPPHEHPTYRVFDEHLIQEQEDKKSFSKSDK